MRRHNGHPKQITHLAIDLSVAYTKNVGDNITNVRMVCNNFNGIQKVVEACDQVRKCKLNRRPFSVHFRTKLVDVA